MYILRSSTSRGRPAFGCAEIGNETTRASFSTASSTPCGPTEQFTPTTSTPMAASSGPKTAGSVP